MQTVNVCLGNAKGGRDCSGLSVVGVPRWPSSSKTLRLRRSRQANSGPWRLPKPVADRLEAELAQIMTSPDVRQRLESKGFVVPEQGSASYSVFVGRERAALDVSVVVLAKAGV